MLYKLIAFTHSFSVEKRHADVFRLCTSHEFRYVLPIPRNDANLTLTVNYCYLLVLNS